MQRSLVEIYSLSEKHIASVLRIEELNIFL
jgi:hypothetical protein